MSVSGDVTEDVQLSTAEIGTYTPGASTGAVEAEWQNDDLSRLLRLTLDVSSPGEVPQGSAFVAVGLGGTSIDDPKTYFPDAVRNTCGVTVSQLDESGIAGTFTCTGLTSVDGTRTINVQGVFDAAVAAPSATPVVVVPPNSAISFTTGAAQATVTRDVAKMITATLLSPGTWSPDTGQLELHYADAAGDTVLVRLRVDSNVTDQFIAIGAPGSTTDDATYFADGLHTQCAATLSRFDATGLDGFFGCSGVPNGAGDMTIDASGSFSAAP